MNNFGVMTSLDKKVINYMAENCVSFNSVESRSFVSLFNSNPSKKLKGRLHYSRIVLPRAYEAFVCLIKANLVKFESLSFTMDIWSSSSYSFISRTAHGINQDRRVANSADFRRQIKNWIASQYRPFSSELEEEPEVLESSQEEPFAKKPRALFARKKVTEVKPLPMPNSWMKNLAFEIMSYNAEKTLIPFFIGKKCEPLPDSLQRRSSISFSAVNIRVQCATLQPCQRSFPLQEGPT